MRAVQRWLFVSGLLAVAACGDDDGTSGGDDAVPGAPDASLLDAGATGQWQTRAAMPVDTQETAVVALDGHVYVLGGLTGSSATIDSIWIYDVATDEWTAGPALPVPMHHANAAVVDGTIYILGALQGAGFSAYGGVYAWVPGGDFIAKAPMPAGTERGSSAVGAIGTDIFVAGGYRGGSVADAHVYDTVADEWAAAPALPEALDHLGGAAAGDTFYAVGGRRGGINGVKSTVYAIEPGDTAWRTVAPMPTARGGFAIGTAGGWIVAVGGEGNPDDSSGVFPDVEGYDPAADRWRVFDPMPVPRHGMGAAGIDGVLYVPGGATTAGFGADATVEAFEPPPL